MEEYKELYKRAFKRLLQMHFEANVGHLGGNLSCLDILLVLKHYTMGPDDRLVISKGHCAGAWYVTQWTAGELTDEDLKTFHGEGTKLAGHLPGTGSLGHGLSIAAGMALGKEMRGEKGFVYCVMSDGEWDEGQVWEAIQFARNNELGNLIIIIDNNQLKGFDRIYLFEGQRQRFMINACTILEYCDQSQIEDFIELLKEIKEWEMRNYPVVINFASIKGQGIITEDKLESHYLPLTEEQYREALRRIDDGMA